MHDSQKYPYQPYGELQGIIKDGGAAFSMLIIHLLGGGGDGGQGEGWA